MTRTGNRSGGSILRALPDLLSSTRTAVALLAVIAVAAMAGICLPGRLAQLYVYGQTWFHVLLGLLGLNLLVCMARRIGLRKVGLSSLLTHGGILLVLAGGLVTLVTAERGTIIVGRGEEVRSFPCGREETVPLGFSVTLLDLRAEFDPPDDYLVIVRPGVLSGPGGAGRKRPGKRSLRLRVAVGSAIAIPGSDRSLENVRFPSIPSGGFVEVRLPDGTLVEVPARVGTSRELGDSGVTLRILRYEPSFTMEFRTKEIASDTKEPRNPALKVEFAREGEPAEARWLFAKVPAFGAHRRGAAVDPVRLPSRFFHPSCPVLEAGSGAERIRIVDGSFVRSPWDPTLILGYAREPGPIRRLEAEIAFPQGEQDPERHVIRVNSPVSHRGAMLSLVDYDETELRWCALSVSRDRGAWVAYVGFVVASLGLLGRFYLRPLISRIRAGSRGEGRK